MVIVQLVRTTWTKASRGQPGAGARAAVPDGFRIETGIRAAAGSGGSAGSVGSSGSSDELVVETVELAEADGFVAVRTATPATHLPGRVANTTIDRDGERVRVTRLAETGSAWPKRSPAIVALRLEVGQWGRLIRNHRHRGYHGWSYEKTVVNVAHLDGSPVDPKLFVAGEPDHLRDEQEPLF